MSAPASLQDLIAARREAAEKLARLDAEIALAMADNGNQGPGKVLDVEQAAARLKCSTDSLYRKHARLRLGYKDPLDGKLKFTTAELDAFIERHRR